MTQSAPIIDKTRPGEKAALRRQPSPNMDLRTIQPLSPPSALNEPRVALPKSTTDIVRQLLASAQIDIAAGKHSTAAARIERAIGIDPGDPVAWHTLAQLRFAQGNHLQARSTALRSNALARASRELVAANWLLIADIERSFGDESAVIAASAKARKVLNVRQTSDTVK